MGALVGGFFVSVMPPLFPRQDKGAREAIVALGKDFNREVHIYDYVGPLIHIADYKKEAYARLLTWEQGEKNVQQWNARVDQANSKTGNVEAKVNMLLKHLGLQISQTPAETKIVKAKR